MAAQSKFFRLFRRQPGLTHGPFSGYLVWTNIILVAIAVIGLASGVGAIFTDILEILLFSSMALSYDFFSGFTGYYNLGFGAFVGFGAYIFTISTNDGLNLFPAFALAGIGSALLAAGVSYPFLRLRGSYFAIASLALILLLGIIDTNEFSYTGGTIGIEVKAASAGYQDPLLVSVLIFTIICILVHYFIGRSRFGLALKSMREDEEITDSFGVNTFRMKQLAMITSGLFAGFSGCLFAVYLQFINSTNIFGLDFGLIPVVAAITGGSGIFLGPVVGAFILSGLDSVVPEIIQAINPTLIIGPLVITGIVLVLVGLFVPGGILRMNSLRTYAYEHPDDFFLKRFRSRKKQNPAGNPTAYPQAK